MTDLTAQEYERIGSHDTIKVNLLKSFKKKRPVQVKFQC